MNAKAKKYILYGLAFYGAWSLRRKVFAVGASLLGGSTQKENI